MKAIETHAIIRGIRSRVDGSVGLSIETPELSPPEKTLFFELQNLNVKLTIKPTDFPDVSLSEINTTKDEKTPSQRLRSVLYVLWEQKGREEEVFEIFYRKAMEKIIENVKRALS